MKRVLLLLAGLLLVGFSASPALAAVSPLPHAFYGTVDINDSPAPVGTEVEARGDNVNTGVGNPITVTEPGKYGGPGGFDPKLVVKGYIEEGTTLTFYVNGESTGLTAEWHSGEITEVPLSLTTEAPTPTPPSEGGGAPTYYLRTDLFRVVDSYRITSEGEIRQTIGGTSKDDMLTISIPKGTIALDKDRKRLRTLEVGIDESPPPPPEDARIVGLAYYFAPAGATFDPPITLTWSYDPDTLPEGVAEEDLVIAYYDEDAGKWVELECVVDTKNNTITASLEHLATVAVIGTVTPAAAFSPSSLGISPTKVAPGEEVSISVSVANVGGAKGSYTVTLKINGVKEADKSVTIAAGKSQEVRFSLIREKAGTYSVAVDGLSSSFSVVAPPPPPPPAPAIFSLSNLTFQPATLRPGEAVTVSVTVANTGGTAGSHTVILNINGVKEAEKSVTIAAGGSETVTFSVTREEAGSYNVDVDGLRGGFTVVALVRPPGINWPLIGGIIAALVVVGLLGFFLVRRRRAA